MTWTKPDREDACGPSLRTIEMAYRPLCSADQVRGLWMDGPWAATPESVPSRGQWSTISRERHDFHTERPDDKKESVLGIFQLALIFPCCQLYTGNCAALFRVFGGKVKRGMSPCAAWHGQLSPSTLQKPVRSDAGIWWSQSQWSGLHNYDH